jgi:SpoIID/LytB domain protein
MRRRISLIIVLLLVQSFRLANAGVAQSADSSALVHVGVARAGGGYTASTIPLETYVARVLAGEAARDSQPAALEALAIAIRTFALANRGRHRADGFDVCDETHCQVMRTATEATVRAATATASQVLMSDGVPASIYYSASCGGHTEIPSAVWPGAADPSYMPAQPDDACAGTPAWVAELSGRDMLTALRAGGFRGQRLREMKIASRTSSGRVARLSLDGLTPPSISGQDLRVVIGRALGWQYIKSTAFELRRDGDHYRFSGHGSGHGVGMCVIGSTRLAVAGQSASEILHRYFPGLTIGTPSDLEPRGLEATRSLEVKRSAALSPAPPPSSASAVSAPVEVRVVPVAPVVAVEPTPTPVARVAGAPARAAVTPEVLVFSPEGDLEDVSATVDLTARARAALARELDLAEPRVTLRFHATTRGFEQATHAPWFTSAATIDGEIHLLPPGVLRERGVLERTIRHELVHAMTSGPLAGRPQWVREGAALYFSGARSGSTPLVSRAVSLPRTSCPDDHELLQPVSVGALTNAYARAEACFARQLGLGKSWRDVK